MRAAIYVRISQDGTGEKAGVTRQRADCETMCGDRGYQVLEVFEDNSVSAFSGRTRPAWERMWSAVDSGHVDVIVAWHPDRMYRRMRDLLEVTELVQKHGVRVETVAAGNVDLSTPEGVMQAQIVGAVAEKESADKRRRITRWHQQRAESGDPPGGGTGPFGHDRQRVTEGRRSRTEWTVRPEEAEVYREAVDRVLSGESVTAIRDRFNAEGRRTPTDRPWTTTLKRMLLSPTKAALRRTKDGSLVEGRWPPLVDRARWEQVQATLEVRETTQQRDSTAYCLTGVLRCGACGEKMFGHRKGSRRRYECRGKSDGPHFAGCGSVSSVAEPLEEFVRDLIVAGLDIEALARLQAYELGGEQRQVELLSALRRMESDYEALADDLADGRLSRTAYQRASRKLEQRIETARARYQTAEQSGVLSAIDGGDVARAWDNGSASWRRALVEQIFTRLELGPAKWRGGQFDRSRVKPPEWRV